jgi:hypothetical protein
MSHAPRCSATAIALAALVFSVGHAAAQTQTQPPNPPRSDIEGQPDPRQDSRSTGAVGQSSRSLSDKLESTGGVIRPQSDIAPDMTVRAPQPEPGTTPVIPPPGAPGGDPNSIPK